MNFTTYLKHLTCWLLMSTIFTFAVGCSIITLPTYHESEYAQLIEIAVVASESSCKPEEMQLLTHLSNRAVFYTAYLPHNGHIAVGVAEMDKTIQALDKTVAPSNAYCHLKLRVITDMATTLAEASAGKPQ